MAQLVARFHGMEEVRGSNPLSSTFCFPGHRSDGVPGFLVAWDALGTGSPMSVLFRFWVADVSAFRFWVANIVIGRRCLGELSAMYADIGNLSGLFAVEAVGILLACTTGHRCRHYPPPPPRNRIVSTVSGAITV